MPGRTAALNNNSRAREEHSVKSLVCDEVFPRVKFTNSTSYEYIVDDEKGLFHDLEKHLVIGEPDRDKQSAIAKAWWLEFRDSARDALNAKRNNVVGQMKKVFLSKFNNDLFWIVYEEE